MSAPLATPPIVVTAAATYTVTRANSTVIFNGASATAIGAWTIPDPTTCANKILKLSSNSGVVNFTVTGGSSIQSNGAALTSLVTGQSIGIQSDGATWYDTDDSPLHPTLQAIAGITDTAGLYRKTGATTAAVVPVGATGLNSISSTTQAEGRTAIGCGTLSVQNDDDVYLRGKIQGYFANSAGSGSKALISSVVDRFFGINRRASSVTSVNATDPFTLGDPSAAMFDSGSSVFSVPANQVGTITVRWVEPGAVGYGFIYAAGELIVTPYPGYPPASIKVDLILGSQATPGTSSTENTVTVGTISTFPAGQSARISIPYTVGGNLLYYARGIILTVTSGATVCYLQTAEYFPALPDDGEIEHWIPCASNKNVDLFAPSLSVKNGANITKVGAGTIQFNGGATQTASLRGVKTIGTPSTTDTITVTGAEIEDIVRVSRGKDAYVSAANTVTFDSTGLAGVSVTAIVERFT